MTSVTKTTQLSIFTIVRDLLRTNSSIAARFPQSSFYEYDPKLKSNAFRGFPYIVIRTPSTDTDLLTFNHTTTMKNFTIPIDLVVEYTARDKFKDYANAIISTIEGGETTMEASGYYNTKIEVSDVQDDAIIDSKEVILGTFDLEVTGAILR